MTKFNAENRQAAAIRELTADELDFVSARRTKPAKPKEKPQPYLVVTLENVLVTS